MPADNLDLVRDLVSNLNEGEYEKGMYLDRLDDIEQTLNSP